MLPPNQSRQALTRLFHHQRVADLKALSAVLETCSRMSVFRRLSALGYFTSYSHNSRYYTLRDIPQFNQDGLWQHQGVCFSRHGSLKATLAHLVGGAAAGLTHHELHMRLQVRVHNMLHDLVESRGIGREIIGGCYLYVSADQERAASQLALRRQQQEVPAKPLRESPAAVVIEVLLDVIQSARVQPDAARVAERLAARGLPVTIDQIETIFSSYGVKKTALSRSRRSQS
jgi:hypothetical protein